MLSQPAQIGLLVFLSVVVVVLCCVVVGVIWLRVVNERMKVAFQREALYAIRSTVVYFRFNDGVFHHGGIYNSSRSSPRVNWALPRRAIAVEPRQRGGFVDWAMVQPALPPDLVALMSTPQSTLLECSRFPTLVLNSCTCRTLYVSVQIGGELLHDTNEWKQRRQLNTLGSRVMGSVIGIDGDERDEIGGLHPDLMVRMLRHQAWAARAHRHVVVGTLVRPAACQLYGSGGAYRPRKGRRHHPAELVVATQQGPWGVATGGIGATRRLDSGNGCVERPHATTGSRGRSGSMDVHVSGTSVFVGSSSCSSSSDVHSIPVSPRSAWPDVSSGDEGRGDPYAVAFDVDSVAVVEDYAAVGGPVGPLAPGSPWAGGAAGR